MFIHAQLRQANPLYPSIFAGLKAMTNDELFGSLTPNEGRFALTQIFAKTKATGKGYQHAMNNLPAALADFRREALLDGDGGDALLTFWTDQIKEIGNVPDVDLFHSF